MIHVDVDIDKRIAYVEVNGALSDILADICTVLREMCEDGNIDPEWLIDALKATFLKGMKREKERKEHEVEYEAEVDGGVLKEFLEKVIGGDKEGAENEVKDERNKEALPGTNRRYRRVRPH